MKKINIGIWLSCCFVFAACTLIPGGIVELTAASATPPSPQASSSAIESGSLPLPPNGFLYHGVYPGGITGGESDLTIGDLRSYENTVGKTAVWVYFSHNWYEGTDFPLETATWIRSAGSIPYIRLMMWSEWVQNQPESLYSLQNIIDGQFDPELHSWCASARDFETRILAEYGVEMNGEWFPWNGK